MPSNASCKHQSWKEKKAQSKASRKNQSDKNKRIMMLINATRAFKRTQIGRQMPVSEINTERLKSRKSPEIEGWPH
jgi:hypothetical protein